MQYPISMKRLFSGFIAGFLATLIFHQLTLMLLWKLGIAPSSPYSMAPVPPCMVPAVFSLAFWGGIWGVLFAVAEGKLPRHGSYWLAAFLFGAVLPSLVALLVVFPLKGKPLGGGWHPPLLATIFLVNGAWAIGTALLLKIFSPRP